MNVKLSRPELADLEHHFNLLIGLSDQDREARLRELSDSHPDLEQQLQDLLISDLLVGDSLEGLELLFESDLPEPNIDLPPSYTLERKLGAGGMGDVFLAKQDEPNRLIAIKMLRRDGRSETVHERFMAEREIMGRLNHPSIAQIYQVGVHQGRPFIAMEYIDGSTISEYSRDLTLEDRLDLFIKVCLAMQHAHQKGIIHRDIKPSNVLVCGTSGSPKVIDFGIAKMTHNPVAAYTLTKDGITVGTPGYVSPEQIVNELDVDTRADVFGLGVLLFEMITGSPVHNLEYASPLAVLKLMQSTLHVDTPKPSDRLHAQGHSLEARTVAGELDWIVAKATARDRQRRYSSVQELATDIQNYLTHRPVSARPPSISYITRKFIRRHKWIVAAGLILSLSIMISLAGIVTGYMRATKAKAIAQNERLRAEKLMSYFTEQLSQSSPDSLGDNLKVSDVLGNMALSLDQDISDPQTRNLVRLNLAGLSYAAGRYEDALTHAQHAHDYFQKQFGPNDTRTIDALFEYGRAEFVFRPTDGMPRVELACAQLSKWQGYLHPKTLNAHSFLALSMTRQDGKAAIELIDKVIAGYAEIGDESARIETLFNRALIVTSLGDFEYANRLYESYLPTAESHFGRDHIVVLKASHSYAQLLQVDSRLNEAEALFEDFTPEFERRYGPDHIKTLLNREIRIGNHIRMGLIHLDTAPDWQDMSVQMNQLIDDFERIQPWVSTNHLREDLGIINTEMGALDEAAIIFENLIELSDASPRTFSVQKAWCTSLLAHVAYKQFDWQRSRELYENALSDWPPSRVPVYRAFTSLRYGILLAEMGECRQSDAIILENYPDIMTVTRQRGLFRIMIDLELKESGAL